MAEVHHFTYGAFNPVAAYLVAVLGSFLGLMSTGRACAARTTGRRTRWLVIAAFSIGGAAIWLMHFTAMLGFDVPASPVRYHPAPMMISLAIAVGTVGAGLLVVGHGDRTVPRIVVSGMLTGLGIMAMHYTGMSGVHVDGHIHYRMPLVVASGVVAVAAATVALWFTVSVRGVLPMLGAAAVMGFAVCGMHYLGMAAMTVELNPVPTGQFNGIRPLMMIVPIVLISAATILGVALSALQAMTEEEFTHGNGHAGRRGVHAEPHGNPPLLYTRLPSSYLYPKKAPRPVPNRPSPTATRGDGTRQETPTA